jgi:1,4-dihydroxy-2-naphthoyl-CoA synthase
MTDKVLYQQDGQIVTITLNDPAMRNPISERETVDAMVAAIERLNQDGSARVAAGAERRSTTNSVFNGSRWRSKSWTCRSLRR